MGLEHTVADRGTPTADAEVLSTVGELLFSEFALTNDLNDKQKRPSLMFLFYELDDESFAGSLPS